LRQRPCAPSVKLQANKYVVTAFYVFFFQWPHTSGPVRCSLKVGEKKNPYNHFLTNENQPLLWIHLVRRGNSTVWEPGIYTPPFFNPTVDLA